MHSGSDWSDLAFWLNFDRSFAFVGFLGVLGLDFGVFLSVGVILLCFCILV